MNIHEATLMNLDRWRAGKKNIGLSYSERMTVKSAATEEEDVHFKLITERKQRKWAGGTG